MDAKERIERAEKELAEAKKQLECEKSSLYEPVKRILNAMYLDEPHKFSIVKVTDYTVEVKIKRGYVLVCREIPEAWNVYCKGLDNGECLATFERR